MGTRLVLMCSLRRLPTLVTYQGSCDWKHHDDLVYLVLLSRFGVLLRKRCVTGAMFGTTLCILRRPWA